MDCGAEAWIWLPTRVQLGFRHCADQGRRWLQSSGGAGRATQQGAAGGPLGVARARSLSVRVREAVRRVVLLRKDGVD